MNDLRSEIILKIKSLYEDLYSLKRKQQSLEYDCKCTWSRETRDSYRDSVIDGGMYESRWSLYHTIQYVKDNSINRTERKLVMLDIKNRKTELKQLNTVLNELQK